MIAFSLLWLAHINMFDGFDFMNDVMDYRDLITKNILKLRPDNDVKSRYLLINTSNNNELLSADNDNQTNIVITDRRILARVLSILNNSSDKIKYVICDIIFDVSDQLNDNNLQDVITQLDEKRKIIIPYYIYEDGEKYIMDTTIIKANRGLSQYQSSFLNTQFLKFSYFSYDSIKQMPLIAFENISGKEMKKRKFLGGNYYTIDNRWCLNTIIPEFRYTSYDLTDLTLYDLGLFTPDLIGENQVVLIGDFQGVRDRHHSMVDEVAGPLIILNALESLFQGDNVIGLSYLLMLFFFFILISYHTFYKNRMKLSIQKKEDQSIIKKYFRTNINYLLILLLTLVSMLFFHHYIHLFILLGYFAFIEMVISFVNKHKKHRIVIK